MKHQTTPEIDIDIELSRVEAEYKRRDSSSMLADRYSRFNEATLFHAQSLEHNVLALLKQYNFINLAEKKILDVGCGNGTQLRRFLEYGAIPTNLTGIDLMPHRIKEARYSHPSIDWQIGSAHLLPYPDATFDLVMSFVVFSSILSESLCKKVADEMWRVRKQGGLILFYDFIYSNPRNPAVRGITHKQIQQFFNRPGARFDFRRVTLAPPIARIVAPHAYWLAYTLEQIKILNTHTIGIISFD